MSALGPVQIVNRALQKLGDLTIRSFEDNTKASRLALDSYDTIRRSELALNIWYFSLVRTTLSFLVDEAGNPIIPSWNYGRTYQMPADCLRIVQLSGQYPGLNLAEYNNTDSREWVIEGDKILTAINTNGTFSPNVVPLDSDGTMPPAPMPILYVADQTDTSKYSAPFVEALACKLAMEWCESLTQSAPKGQMAEARYNTAIRYARSQGACQQPPQMRPDSTWIISRVT